MLSVPQRRAFTIFVPICWDNMLSVSKTRPFSILSQFGGTIIMLSVSQTRALSILSQFAWTTCYRVSDKTVFYFVLFAGAAWRPPLFVMRAISVAYWPPALRLIQKIEPGTDHTKSQS